MEWWSNAYAVLHHFITSSLFYLFAIIFFDSSFQSTRANLEISDGWSIALRATIDPSLPSRLEALLPLGSPLLR
jgi:hypothetical protein